MCCSLYTVYVILTFDVSIPQANREGENRMSNQSQTQEYHDVPGP